jgi:hypothetical protein
MSAIRIAVSPSTAHVTRPGASRRKKVLIAGKTWQWTTLNPQLFYHVIVTSNHRVSTALVANTCNRLAKNISLDRVLDEAKVIT